MARQFFFYKELKLLLLLLLIVICLTVTAYILGLHVWRCFKGAVYKKTTGVAAASQSPIRKRRGCFKKLHEKSNFRYCGKKNYRRDAIRQIA